MLYKICIILFLLITIRTFASNELYINDKWQPGLPTWQDVVNNNYDRETCSKISSYESCIYYLELINSMHTSINKS